MKILLILFFLAPFIYFGYLMTRLDGFLAGNIKEANGLSDYSSAIVLGENDLAGQVCQLLQEHQIKVIRMLEPSLFEREQRHKYLFALSENDADNIVLCKVGKKLYNIEAMIAVCNERKHEGMFQGEKIPYQLKERAAAQSVYKAVFKELRVK